MIQKLFASILSLFSEETPKPQAPLESTKASAPQRSTDALNDDLETLISIGFDLKHHTKKAWVNIPPVKVSTRFMGWGFVSGRKEALKINSRLHLVEADDDMDFTEYCILVDKVPCLLLLFRGNRLGVTMIHESVPFEQAVFKTNMIPCSNAKEFQSMPKPVQDIMLDTLDCILSIAKPKLKAPDESIPFEV